jgi:hypothetical protein
MDQLSAPLEVAVTAYQPVVAKVRADGLGVLQDVDGGHYIEHGYDKHGKRIQVS